MSKTKIGVFSILAFGVMMLLIPATSIASAQEYDDRYYEDERYYEDNDEYTYEEYYYPPKDKKKEPPMLVVKKDVLYCDLYSGSDQNCNENGGFLGPDSERYVQTCTATMNTEGTVCDNINEETFRIIVTEDIEFSGSEEGTKLTVEGERYTVTEESNIGNEEQSSGFNFTCKESGFDGGFTIGLDNTEAVICTLNEGDCSGFLQDGQQKECTVKNYVVTNGG